MNRLLMALFFIFSMQAECAVRCELLFTPYGGFLLSRERIMLQPLENTLADAKVKTTFADLNQWLKLSDLITADFDQITERILTLSSKDQSDLLDYITKHYQEISSEKYQSLKQKELKRIFDLILTRLDAPEKLFVDTTDQSAWTTYRKFYDRNRKHVGLESDLTSHQVWSFLNWIKLRLNKYEKVNPRLNGAEIIIYGSFVNGRAQAHVSDIDAIVNSKQAEQFIDDLNSDPFFKDFKMDHVGANSMRAFSQWNAAQLNPVLFIVNAQHIILKVHRPLTYLQIHEKVSPESKTFILD